MVAEHTMTLRMDEQLANRAKHVASVKGVPLSEFVRECIEKEIESFYQSDEYMDRLNAMMKKTAEEAKEILKQGKL